MLTLNNPIDIDKQGVYSRIGCDDDYRPSARITTLVDDYIENYHDFLSPSYSYKIRDIISVEGNRIDLGDSIILESKIIGKLLGKCEKVAVFALTIGNYLEDLVAHLADNGLIVQATVLDAIGSGTAEELAATVEDRVKVITTAEGMVISRRFSPGYCDWKVSQQRMVFRALGEDTAGVKLNKNMLMLPQKSISGIIGIGLPGREIEQYNPCQTCSKKDCPGRRR